MNSFPPVIPKAPDAVLKLYLSSPTNTDPKVLATPTVSILTNILLLLGRLDVGLIVNTLPLIVALLGLLPPPTVIVSIKMPGDPI